MSQTTNDPGFDTGTPTTPPRKAWWRRKLVVISASGLALILAASIGAIAAGGGSRTGSASQRPVTPPDIYANANQIVQALKAHHVPVTNVVADSGFWSGEGATSGVWATTAPGDSGAVFGGSDNPVQDTEIVVFQNHAKAVAYANLSTDPNAGDPDPDHQTILGTNWAVDAATPAAPGLRAALGGTLIPNVPASMAPAAPSAPASQPAAPAPANADRLTLDGCKALANWEANYDGPDTASTSPTIKAIAVKATGTQFGTDLHRWITDPSDGSNNTMADGETVGNDCKAVGVNIYGAPNAPAAPSTEPSKPAVTETSTDLFVKFTVTGTGQPTIQYGSDSDTRDGGGHLGALGEGNYLPWSATMAEDDNALYYDVTAQLQGYGDITATVSEVTVHHFSNHTTKTETRVLKTAHASGGYNIAMAEAM